MPPAQFPFLEYLFSPLSRCFWYCKFKKVLHIRNPFFIITSCLLTAVFFTSCGRSVNSAPQVSAASATQAAPDRYAQPTPRSREANDVARFLAGLPGIDDSPFAELEKTEAWKQHRRDMDAAWNHYDQGTMAGMRKFQGTELSSPAIEKSLVFYPFSGPDTLTITAFFPKNPTYVMVAWEPVGTIPTLKQLSRGDLAAKLAATRQSLSSLLGKSFFVTREMDHQFRGQVTDGLFAPITNLLVRTGHTILGYKYVRLDDKGAIIDRGPDVSPKAGDKGVEIDFTTDTDHSTHKLFYFCVNLDNEHMAKNPPFTSFLAGLKDVSTFFKATSYMIHQDGFSMIRDAVLEHSQAVLQDDSGIPYKYFNPATWHINLYGAYSQPYGSFRYLIQPDLRKAFATEARPLEFRIGYGFSKAPSNLLFATKNNGAIASKADQR